MDQEPIVVPSRSLKSAALGVVMIVVLVGLAFVAWKFGSDARKTAMRQHDQIDRLEMTIAGLKNSLNEQTPGTIEDPYASPLDSGTELPKPPVSEAPVKVALGGILDIDWKPLEQQVESPSIPALTNAFAYTDTNGYQEHFTDSSYALGTVKGGVYDGYDLVGQRIDEAGMGATASTIYILVPQSPILKSVIVERYTSHTTFFNVYGNEITSALALFAEPALVRLGGELVFDISVRIPELERGPIYSDAKGNQYRIRNVFEHDPEYLTKSYAKEQRGTPFTVTQDSTRITVFENAGTFYGMREDGRALAMTLVIPNALWDAAGESAQVPQITWKDDGSKNEAQFYRGVRGGCGFVSDAAIVKESDVGPMEVAATFMDKGRSVDLYRPTSKDAQIWKDAGSQITYGDGGTIVSEVSPFEKPHSLFLYKDALGRWNRFVSPDFGPQAECGKPVIYLYPPQATNVSVQLAPVGGFTKTEPAYGEGWNVHASPDGTLVNKADGMTYPYLFWEGVGGRYAFPERYWVVERSKVASFLTETLGKIGFNDKEIADFNEFWLPRMQDAPWYKIGFHGNDAMDALAPMNVSPTPDSVLRVLMDYAELDAPEASNPPTFHPFVRKGFSVVEWGGTLEAGE